MRNKKSIFRMNLSQKRNKERRRKIKEKGRALFNAYFLYSDYDPTALRVARLAYETSVPDSQLPELAAVVDVVL